MPRHINPTSPARIATAPYNFIPLPERIFTVEDGLTLNDQLVKPWERQDEIIPGTTSGWIDLDITTLTPLFIRGPLRLRRKEWDRRDNRVRPESFATADGRPIIPGSTLRGTIRTLVEMLSFSKMRSVNHSKPFYRSVGNDRIGLAYRDRMIRKGIKPSAGFLNMKVSGLASITQCEVLQIDRSSVSQGIAVSPNLPPQWPQQHCQCWVISSPANDTVVDQVAFQETAPSAVKNWRPGRLVMTGFVPGKKREFVFLQPSAIAPCVTIPSSIWNRFHDADQITQWQEKAFPRDQPTNGCRKRAGFLRDGEPVFFLTDDSAMCEENPAGLLFFGRAQMFRFPYDLSPADLVPESLSHAGLDISEAVFGRVGSDRATAGTTLKGRVFFEDAVAYQGGPAWTENLLVPRILSAPKPTSFQHYLTQDGMQRAQELTTYLNGDRTTIRGHKLYWHRWDQSQGVEQAREKAGHEEKLADLSHGREARHSQHTIIQPIKADIRFKSRVRFHNLTDVELGALLTALDLPEGCAHKIGMGKSLGLGSVRIQTTLYVMDRSECYSSWSSNGVTSKLGENFRDAFATVILHHAQTSGEAILPQGRGLGRIGRLDALFLMLEWKGRPRAEAIRHMESPTEFRGRPVLQTPHKVMGREEPPWRRDPPRPARSETVEVASVASSSFAKPPATRPSQPTHPTPKPLGKGQTRQGTLEQRDGLWIARFDEVDREAQIENPKAIPENAKAKMKAEFYILEQSKKHVLVRFSKMIPL